MYTFAKTSRWMLTLVIAAALSACVAKTESQTTPAAPVTAAPSGVDALAPPTQAAVPDDFVPQADKHNQQLAAKLADAKPFADDSIPEDAQAVFDGLTRASTGCDSGPNGMIDETRFAYPTSHCDLNDKGYPTFMLKCDLVTRQCIDVVDRVFVGTVEQVAPQLPPVHNTDVLNEDYICDRICIDDKNHVVGSVSSTMEAWMAAKAAKATIE